MLRFFQTLLFFLLRKLKINEDKINLNKVFFSRDLLTPGRHRRTGVSDPDNFLQRSQVIFSPLNRALHRSASVVMPSSAPLPKMDWGRTAFLVPVRGPALDSTDGLAYHSVPEAFNKVLESDADLAVAVAAITILTEVIKVSKGRNSHPNASDTRCADGSVALVVQRTQCMRCSSNSKRPLTSYSNVVPPFRSHRDVLSSPTL